MSDTETAAVAGAQNIDRSGRYLTFQLGDQSYGISVLKVREIIQIQPITKVPRTPDYMQGVINLRGKVIPVADLRVRFGFENADVNERTCIVVVLLEMPDGRESFTGLIVDAVEEVMQIGSEEIEDAPSFADAAISIEYIYGMAKVKGGVKMLLDIDRVISAASVAETLGE